MPASLGALTTGMLSGVEVKQQDVCSSCGHCLGPVPTDAPLAILVCLVRAAMPTSPGCLVGPTWALALAAIATAMPAPVTLYMATAW